MFFITTYHLIVKYDNVLKQKQHHNNNPIFETPLDIYPLKFDQPEIAINNILYTITKQSYRLSTSNGESQIELVVAVE